MWSCGIIQNMQYWYEPLRYLSLIRQNYVIWCWPCGEDLLVITTVSSHRRGCLRPHHRYHHHQLLTEILTTRHGQHHHSSLPQHRNSILLFASWICLCPAADTFCRFLQTLVDSCSLKTPADFSCLLQTPSVICRLLQSPVADSRSVPPGLLAEIVLPGRFWTNIFQEVRKSLSDPRWVEHH